MPIGSGSVGVSESVRRPVGPKGGDVVTDATGAVFALKASLPAPITWSKVSGHSNLTVSGSHIAATAVIPEDTTQTIIVRAVSGTSAVEFEVALTGKAPVIIPVPTFLSNPTVTGSPVVGATLTATTGVIDVGRIIVSQWYRGNTPIPGQTGASYQLTVADEGQIVTYRQTAASIAGSMVGSSSDVTVVFPVPTFITQPAISGTAVIGNVLTATSGAVNYGSVTGGQWLRNGVAISGETNSTYLLVDIDDGAIIGYRASASSSGGSNTATVTGTMVVAPFPTFTVAPTITGVSMVGETLTGVDGTIDRGSITASQWLRNGVAIPGATSNAYTLVPGDDTATLTYRQTATTSGGSYGRSSVGRLIGNSLNLFSAINGEILLSPIDGTPLVAAEIVTPPTAFSVTGTLDSSHWATAYTDSLTVVGGTGPYSISGLPSGLDGNITNNTIAVTGTPV